MHLCRVLRLVHKETHPHEVAGGAEARTCGHLLLAGVRRVDARQLGACASGAVRCMRCWGACGPHCSSAHSRRLAGCHDARVAGRDDKSAGRSCLEQPVSFQATWGGGVSRPPWPVGRIAAACTAADSPATVTSGLRCGTSLCASAFRCIAAASLRKRAEGKHSSLCVGAALQLCVDPTPTGLQPVS